MIILVTKFTSGIGAAIQVKLANLSMASISLYAALGATVMPGNCRRITGSGIGNDSPMHSVKRRNNPAQRCESSSK